MNLRVWVCFILCILLGSCSVVPEGMMTADRLMETQPDSSLHILRRLPPAACSSGSNRALYGLLMVRALDKNMLPLKPDTLLDFSIGYYQAHGDNEHLATCYLFKGRMYKYALQYEMAMNYYLRALDAAEVKNDAALQGRINLDMGDICLSQKDYVLARSKYHTAYRSFVESKFQSQAFYALVNIGRTYYAEKDYCNAKIYFHAIASRARDSLQQGALLQAQALNYYRYGRLDTALAYFRKVIRYPYIGNNRAIRYYNLADLYFDRQQFDSAYQYARHALDYTPDIRSRRECYRILANAVSLKGDLPALGRYMKYYQNCSDSIRAIDAQTRGSVLESIHNAHNEAVTTRTLLECVIVFSLITLLALLLYYFRHRNHHHHEVLRSQEKQINQKISDRYDIISGYREALSTKINAVKTKQATVRQQATFADLELMDRQLYEEVLHLNDPDLFYREMDIVLNNLAGKLRNRYPALSPKEIVWCCLNILMIPKNDVCLILEYKSNSLKKMKQRLAQKLNLPDASELDDFLSRLLFSSLPPL